MQTSSDGIFYCKEGKMLIVGLGNPGKEYENTFHNMGFTAIEALAARFNKKINRLECSALTAVTSVKGEKVIFAKPLTYMNLSGVAVKGLLTKYGQTLSDLIVIYDDIDLPRFTLRARERGSAGTHNGMRNIVENLGSTEFRRIRIGIGRDGRELKDYVLTEISPEDRKVFAERTESLAVLLEEYIRNGDFEKLMREANGIK